MTQEQNNENAVRNFFKVLSTGEMENIRPLFHPDAAWIVNVKDIPGAGTHKGRDTICDVFLAPVRGAFVDGDPKTEIDTVVAQGDWVAVMSRAVGAARESGKVYDNKYAWFVKLQDGLVLEIYEHMDSLYTSRWWG